MADLFALEDLPSWLQVPSVDTDTATRVRKAAQGWLAQATGLTAWPSPVPDQLWAWALELAAIAYNNPGAVNTEQIDDYQVSYGDRMRRAEILKAARAAYNTGAQPQYSFPDADWHWTTAVSLSALPD